MKTSKTALTFMMGTVLMSQSVLAGIPYSSDRTNIVIPSDKVGMVLPSIKSFAETNGKVEINPDEVFLVPNSLATFKLTHASEVHDGGPNLEDRCFEYSIDSSAWRRKMMKVAAEEQKVEEYITEKEELEIELEDLILDGDQEEIDRAQKKIEMLGKRIARKLDSISDLRAVVDQGKENLGKLENVAALNLRGAWTNSFAAEAKIIRDANANPNLKVTELPTTIKGVSTTGMGVGSARPFRFLRINGIDYVNDLPQSNTIKATIPYKPEEVSEVKTVEVDGKPEEKLAVSVAKLTNLSPEKQVNYVNIGQSGSVEMGLNLSPACKVLAGKDVGAGNIFTMVKSFSTAVYFHGEAKYNLSKLYSYFEKNKKGPQDGWNITKQTLSKKVRENLTSKNGFEFIYACEAQGACPDEEKTREEMKTRLIDVGMKLFTESVLDTTKESLPLPANELGEALGNGAAAFYGPQAKVIVKPLADLFASSESEVDIKRRIDVNVSEKWNSIYFTEILTSQTVNIEQ